METPPRPELPPPDFPFAKAQAVLRQCRDLQPYFLGDYYPLTEYSKAGNVWVAWQFDRPDRGNGMVQAFRRPARSARGARSACRD